MSMIKIEFPAGDKVAAAAFATALRAVARANDNELTAAEYRALADSPAEPVADTDAGAKDDELTAAAYRALADSPAEPVADTVTTQTTAPAGDAPRDPKGVVFDPEFCGNATQPYYNSGKRAGQWKKRKGVTEEAYDAWYAAQLANIAAVESPDPQPINTAGAFGGGRQSPPPPAQDDTPADIGGFMGWVSEKQAAGALTQDAINAAWLEAGVEMVDLFNQPETEVQASIKRVYDVLCTKVVA